MPFFKPGSIRILYRDKIIKVFYKNIQQAHADGYYEFDEDKFSEKSYIYSFSGLRGDAKNLYKKIVNGKENRVSLTHCENDASARGYLE